MIDEFPGIDRVEGVASLLRTKLQHHFQEIGLVFAGSQPSLMRSMFTDRARPFYAQADLVEIGPFDPAAAKEIIDDAGGEKSVMRLLAHGEALFGNAAEVLDVSPGGAQYAVGSLIASGDVTTTAQRRTIVDPVIADWVRRRFPR